MPKIDFSQVENVGDYRAVPKDRYLIKVVEIRERSTSHGDEMWGLQLEIQDGKYKGRFMFDNMVFSEAAMPRVKLICSRLGLDVSGEIELTRDLILGRVAWVDADIEDYTDDDGNTKPRNVIPFAGYERASAEEVEAAGSGTAESESEDDASEDGIPF